MMLRIISLTKKILHKFKKKKEKPGKGPQVPEGNKIAVFGHTNVGKTVFFVMAHEAGREDVDFRLDTKDDQTAAELLSNLRLLEGLEATVADGMRSEKRVERRFPPPTSETKVLNFVAVLNQSKRFDFSSLDYRGEIASIEEQPELKEELIKFCLKSNCILFFIEPQVISSELYCRNQMASFKSLLQQLLNGKPNLPVPIGVVVTKSDLYDDFQDDSQTVLISRPYEFAKTKRYDQFVLQLLDQPHVKRSDRWKKDVKQVLERMEDFFETLTSLSSDYQVFFVSALGSRPPQKQDDSGATVFCPPRQLKPIGVTEPLKWAVNRILQQKRIKAWKTVTRVVFWLAFIWCLFYSIPNLLNLGFWYPDLLSGEQKLSASGYKSKAMLNRLSQEDQKPLKKPFERYFNKFLVGSFFGMDSLEYFARHRFDGVVAAAPEPKKPEPVVDSAFQKEKGDYDKLESEFNKLKSEINKYSENDRLEKAPDKLMAFQATLDASQLSSQTATNKIQSMKRQIDKYLQKMECWDKEKAFSITVDKIPDGYGLYVFIGKNKYGRIYNNTKTDTKVVWKKGEQVIYQLRNENTGKPTDKPIEGNYGIVQTIIEFPEIPTKLVITKKGFDCEVPAL
jgi:GTPase SAR1 family protein